MEIKTHLNKIENYFIYVPIFLFFVYPFLINTSSVLHLYYLITFLIIIIFNKFAASLIQKHEDLIFKRFKTAYRIFIAGYILILAISGYFQYLLWLSRME